MAVLPSPTGYSTLIDIARTFGPDGKPYRVAELLNQSNEIVQYLPFKEGNLPTGHKAAVRTEIPTATLARFYKGVSPTKAEQAIVEDVCGTVIIRNQVDRRLADLNANAEAYRLSQARASIEAMTQRFATSIMYGDTTVNKDDVLGFTPRYNALSGATGQNIISAGGSGSDNMSMWLVVPGEETVCGIYPKGSQAGLNQKDLGELDAYDSTGAPFRVLADLFEWTFGLHVADWRYAVRIANIDVSDLKGQTGTQANTAATWLPNLMMQAFSKIPSMGMGPAYFLANRTAKTWLSISAMQKTVFGLTMEQAGGQFGRVEAGSVAGTGTGISGGTLKFFETPVLTVDQLLLTETVVS